MQTGIEQIYQQVVRQVFATLVRLLKDFDLAEDALQDAYLSALEQWPHDGIPHNPAAWLISAGRFKAIDQLRRRSHFNDNLLPQLTDLESGFYDFDPERELSIHDDQLRLIFTCCHPALAQEAQLALTLREVCGLTTEAIARAFVSKAPAIAQRIVRAKNKIRDANIPYEIPAQNQLPERLNGVLKVIYLLFNEGYSAASGDETLRNDLSSEAIRLAHLLCVLLPQEHSESMGLLALLLLQDARRAARIDEQGELILLEDQNRDLWNRAQIREGLEWITRALQLGPVGSYSLQAAIAAVHAEARDFAATDWRQIAALYQRLYTQEPSPVVALNHAVAVSMMTEGGGPEVALTLVDELLSHGQLDDYHLLHAARADFLRRLQRPAEALPAYEKALSLTSSGSELRFLQRRIDECRQAADKKN